MKKLIITAIILLLIFPTNAECSSKFDFFARLIGTNIKKKIEQNEKQYQKKLTKEYQKEHERIKKETCDLFKLKILEKKIKHKDLDFISRFIRDRIRAPNNNKYKNITEQVGFDLIDDRLTIVDYEKIQEMIKAFFVSVNKYNKLMRKFQPYNIFPGLPLPFPGGLSL